MRDGSFHGPWKLRRDMKDSNIENKEQSLKPPKVPLSSLFIYNSTSSLSGNFRLIDSVTSMKILQFKGIDTVLLKKI